MVMDDVHGGTAEFRRRAAALRALARQPDGGSPALDEALRVFGSERELLLAAHQRWQVHLLARLDQAIELGADDPHEEVRRTVQDVGRAMPGIAALLRQHASDPALAVARRRLAAYVDQACPCGRAHPLVAPAPRPSTASVAIRQARAVAARSCRWLHRLPPCPLRSGPSGRRRPEGGASPAYGFVLVAGPH
jgi:hypothetical protein